MYSRSGLLCSNSFLRFWQIPRHEACNMIERPELVDIKLTGWKMKPKLGLQRCEQVDQSQRIQYAVLKEIAIKCLHVDIELVCEDESDSIQTVCSRDHECVPAGLEIWSRNR